jgi:hypothetical protein
VAYLFPETSHLQAVGAPTPISSTIARPPGHFTPLEWSAVALGRGDGLSTIRLPNRISMILNLLFGARQNPRLADPRLEALRRIAVLSRHYGASIHEGEIHAFIAAGYTLRQYELVVLSSGSARHCRVVDQA